MFLGSTKMGSSFSEVNWGLLATVVGLDSTGLGLLYSAQAASDLGPHIPSSFPEYNPASFNCFCLAIISGLGTKGGLEVVMGGLEVVMGGLEVVMGGLDTTVEKIGFIKVLVLGPQVPDATQSCSYISSLEGFLLEV
jgi:hypothetical protein